MFRIHSLWKSATKGMEPGRRATRAAATRRTRGNRVGPKDVGADGGRSGPAGRCSRRRRQPVSGSGTKQRRLSGSIQALGSTPRKARTTRKDRAPRPARAFRRSCRRGMHRIGFSGDDDGVPAELRQVAGELCGASGRPRPRKARDECLTRAHGAYHFRLPGRGRQRPHKFARYLPEFGWDPVVIARKPDPIASPRRQLRRKALAGRGARSFRVVAPPGRAPQGLDRPAQAPLVRPRSRDRLAPPPWSSGCRT